MIFGKNKIKKENAILLKYFLILSALFVLAFNWNRISWLFYPEIVRGVLADYVFKYSEGSSGLVSTKISPDILEQNNLSPDACQADSGIANSSCFVQPETVRESPTEASKEYKGDFIKIPKINISAPIVFVKSEQLYQYRTFMKKGVLHYPQSSLPGQEGAAIILGHSAPPNWPKINYDWIFNDLNLLSNGDEILFDFQGKSFVYQVEKKYIINKGEELNPDLTNSKSVVVLISCWPAGKNEQRIIIEANLKK